MGSPKNIVILELDLEGSRSYQNLIYGSPSSQNFDGIHLNGEGAVRQFTYQAIKQFKLKLFGTDQTKSKPLQKSLEFDNNHTNCPQSSPVSEKMLALYVGTRVTSSTMFPLTIVTIL